MTSTQKMFLAGERTKEGLFRLVIPSLHSIEITEMKDCHQCVRMIGTEMFLPDKQDVLV